MKSVPATNSVRSLPLKGGGLGWGSQSTLLCYSPPRLERSMTEQPAARSMPIAVGLAIVLLTLVAVGSASMFFYLLYIAFIAERSVRPEEIFFVFFSPLLALIGFAIVSGLLRRAYWALNAARALIGILSLLGISSVVTGGDMF